MKLIELTPLNIRNYIGYDILFKTDNKLTIKKIIKVSKSNKTINIDLPKLNNCLQIVTRKVYVII